MTTSNPTPTQQGETLLPCPFCGGEAVLLDDAASEYDADGRVYHVTCLDSCSIAPGIYGQDSKEEAIRKWNSRPPVDTQRDKLCDKHKCEYEVFHVGGCIKCWQENECESSARAAVAGLRGDAVSRKEVVARIEQQIRLWNNDTVTMACADMLAEIKQMSSAEKEFDAETLVKKWIETLQDESHVTDEDAEDLVLRVIAFRPAPAERTRVEGERVRALDAIEQYARQLLNPINPMATATGVQMIGYEIICHVQSLRDKAPTPLPRTAVKVDLLKQLTEECPVCRGPNGACDCLPPLVVTRDGIPCSDQKAALEEFKERCRAAAPADNDAEYECDGVNCPPRAHDHKVLL